MLNWLPTPIHDGLKQIAFLPRRLRGKYIPRYPAPLGRDALIKALAALPGFDQDRSTTSTPGTFVTPNATATFPSATLSPTKKRSRSAR